MARRGPDGGWQALEVHIFPEAMRGLSEGHYPWDFPGTTMTNAAIVVASKGPDGSLTALRIYVGQDGVMPPF